VEIHEVSKKIESKLGELTQLSSQLIHKAQDKAQCIADYDKALAKTIIALRNGDSFDIEAYKIQCPPTTIIEKVAKGIIWKKKLDMDMAESQYKILGTQIEIVKAQLNGLQTINRHLSHI